MLAKSIIKLIDEAIVPACALILGKVAGLVLAAWLFKLNLQIEQGAILGLLPQVRFPTHEALLTAENYANLLMFTVVAIGTILVILRAHYLHSSHIHPSLAAKLAGLNLEGLIAESYHLYHQAAIWLLYLWLVVGFLITSSISQITHPYLAVAAVILAANFSWVLAIDVEREVEINKAS